jgi:hypothetical protein
MTKKVEFFNQKVDLLNQKVEFLNQINFVDSKPYFNFDIINN